MPTKIKRKKYYTPRRLVDPSERQKQEFSKSGAFAGAVFRDAIRAKRHASWTRRPYTCLDGGSSGSNRRFPEFQDLLSLGQIRSFSWLRWCRSSTGADRVQLPLMRTLQPWQIVFHIVFSPYHLHVSASADSSRTWCKH